ncbi:sigma 54-interacting transcriptional regulator [Enterocloster clostridioformis]|uniref:sigma 54-interacting transcriptional regulator n=1 Tax=Enterocloster clostridioformis TaxID=1531 RepID=UPI001F41CBE2|nr:sigma 54-interacting transcriptional regulator [Enterocloster clostridioformis]MCF2704425.1 sigma 54-interacting transcriptional regulator [Enterocloster clostridioformis]
MYENELLIISVYPGMMNDINAVCGSLQINPTILEWEIAENTLISHLRNMFRETGVPDAIISRGATANLIEQNIPEAVSARAEPGDLELLETLKAAKNHGPRIGLLMFEDYLKSYNLQAAKELLGINSLTLYPFRSREDIIRLVRQGSTDGMDVLVGGGTLAYRTGNSCGIKVLPVYSGQHALRNAVKQALSIIDARQREKLQLKCFTEAVSSITEGVLSIEDGKFIVANKEMGNIFKTDEQALIGRKVDNTDDTLVAGYIRHFLTNSREREKVLKILGQDYYIKKSHFEEKGKKRIVAIFRRARDIQDQEQRVRTEIRNTGFFARYHFSDIIAESGIMRQLLKKAETYAATDANILIGGDSGTGKELLAQSIHNASSRAKEPFVAVNCAAIPATLLESELFGYEEGAFSGASKGGKRGLFELAHKGTIFLDEINSMPLELQSVLLRTLQEKEIRRIGSQRNIYIDIRVIAASNSDLMKMIREEKFRIDLYYRLNTLRLTLPSLDKRREDIRPLAMSFLNHYSQKYSLPLPALSEDNYRLLENRNWQGNIRELRNVMQRYVILSHEGENSIQLCFDEDIATEAALEPQDVTSFGTLDEIEKAVILKRLKQNQGNRRKTAQELGISRSTLWKKLDKMELDQEITSY